MKAFQVVLVVASIIGLIWSLGLFFYTIFTKDFYQMSGGAFFISAFVLLYAIIVFIAGIIYKNTLFKIMPIIGFVLSLAIIILSLIIQRDYDLENKRFTIDHNLSCWVTLGISSVYAVVFEIVTLVQSIKIKII